MIVYPRRDRLPLIGSRYKDERQPQPMADDGRPPPEAFGLGRANEIAPQHVEHGVSLVEAIERNLPQDQAQRGQNEVLQFNLDEAAKRQKDLYTDLDARMRAMEMAKIESKAAAVVQ